MADRTRTLIRHYRKEDKDAVLGLFQACWDEEKSAMNRACWEWLYEQNPNTAPERPVIFIMEDGGEIIGSVSCVPARLLVHGRAQPLHWVMDYMIHPRHRGGLRGFRLAQQVIQLSAATLGSGFPIQETVPIWLRAGRKVGVDEVGGFGPVVLPLTVRYVLQRKTLAPMVTRPLDLLFRPLMAAHRAWRGLGAPARRPGTTLREIDRFDERITGFFDRVGSGYPIIVIRDEAYLNWRYCDYPAKTYRRVLAEGADGEILGYMVIRTGRKPNGIREGFLVDFLVELGDRSTLRQLVHWAVARFRREGCDVVKALEFHLPEMRRAFRQLGFMVHPVKRHYLIFYNEICPDEPKAFFRDQRNWYLTRNFADQEINEHLQ